MLQGLIVNTALENLESLEANGRIYLVRMSNMHVRLFVPRIFFSYFDSNSIFPHYQCFYKGLVANYFAFPLLLSQSFGPIDRIAERQEELFSCGQ